MAIPLRCIFRFDQNLILFSCWLKTGSWCRRLNSMNSDNSFKSDWLCGKCTPFWSWQIVCLQLTIEFAIVILSIVILSRKFWRIPKFCKHLPRGSLPMSVQHILTIQKYDIFRKSSEIFHHINPWWKLSWYGQVVPKGHLKSVRWQILQKMKSVRY